MFKFAEILLQSGSNFSIFPRILSEDLEFLLRFFSQRKPPQKKHEKPQGITLRVGRRSIATPGIPRSENTPGAVSEWVKWSEGDVRVD